MSDRKVYPMLRWGNLLISRAAVKQQELRITEAAEYDRLAALPQAEKLP